MNLYSDDNIITFSLQMPRLGLSSLLLKLDLLSSTEFLKTQQQPVYKTKTGGCITILFIIIIAVILALRINTRQRGELLQFISKTVFSNDEIHFTTSSVVNNKFMMGVKITSNSNSLPFYIGKEHFTISMAYDRFVTDKGTPISSDQNIIYFQTCTADHWNINLEILQIYNYFYYDLGFMCLPNNVSFSLAGQIKSKGDIFTNTRISIEQCQWQHGTSNQSASFCSNDSNFKELLDNDTQFDVEMIFSNAFINPTEIAYKTNYIDTTLLYFKGKSTIFIDWAISKYKISTDRNYLSPVPQGQPSREEGAYFKEKPIVRKQQSQKVQEKKRQFAQINFKRSFETLIIERNDEKLIDMFSYIGGLGASLFAIFQVIASKYSTYCFEVDVNDRLFEDYKKDREKGENDPAQGQLNDIKRQPKDSQQQGHQKSACFSKSNFLTFLRDKFKCCSSNEQSEKDKKRLLDRLDIGLIVQKLSILEKIIVQIHQHGIINLKAVSQQRETDIESQKFDTIFQMFYPEGLKRKDQVPPESSDNLRLEGLQIILNPIVNGSQMQQNKPEEREEVQLKYINTLAVLQSDNFLDEYKSKQEIINENSSNPYILNFQRNPDEKLSGRDSYIEKHEKQ